MQQAYILGAVEQRLQPIDAAPEQDGGKARHDADQQGNKPKLYLPRPPPPQHAPPVTASRDGLHEWPGQAGSVGFGHRRLW